MTHLSARLGVGCGGFGPPFGVCTGGLGGRSVANREALSPVARLVVNRALSPVEAPITGSTNPSDF